MKKAQWIIASVTMAATMNGMADVPLYKPSSRSPEAIDITSNAYGASELAPTALAIGEITPKFDLNISGGGTYDLFASDADKPLAVVFYRGHW